MFSYLLGNHCILTKTLMICGTVTALILGLSGPTQASKLYVANNGVKIL